MKLSKLKNKVGELFVDKLDFTDADIIKNAKRIIAEYENGEYSSTDVVSELMITALAFAYADGIDVKYVTNLSIDEMIAMYTPDIENQNENPRDAMKAEIEITVKAIVNKYGVKIESINQEYVD